MQQTKKWNKRLKVFTLGLIVSVTCNVVLLTLFFTRYLGESPLVQSFDLKPLFLEASKKEGKSLAEAIDRLSGLSFKELVSLLSSKDPLEEGYTLRDVALTCLITYHHFNLMGAIPDNIQKRTFLLRQQDQDGQKIIFYPGLTDEQHELINHYACTEKWPLTSKGLFSLLKKWVGSTDDSLEKAFFHSEEFVWVEALFGLSGQKADQKQLLQMLLDRDFDHLKNFINQNHEITDVTLRKFLLSYIFCKSSIACSMLLRSDFHFAVKKLDDQTILHILPLLNEVTEDVEKYCKELIQSSRSDAVWEKSAEILFRNVNEVLPDPYDHQLTLKRFISFIPEEKKQEPIPQPLPEVKFTTYKVKEGDTLWKIARRFHVGISKIIDYNQLNSDKIHPGREIKIPQQ